MEEDVDGVCGADKGSVDEADGQDGEDTDEDVEVEEDEIAGEGEKTNEILYLKF